jgi:hypothetical protein
MGSELGAGGRSGGHRGIHGTSLRGRHRAISRGTQESWSPGVSTEHLWLQKWFGKPSMEFGWSYLPSWVSLARDGSSRHSSIAGGKWLISGEAQSPRERGSQRLPFHHP